MTERSLRVLEFHKIRAQLTQYCESDMGAQLCAGLTSVEISEGVQSIGESAFAYCANLTSLTIPASVTSIGDAALQQCPKLKSLTFKGETAPAIGRNLLSAEGDHGSLEKITVPEGSKEAYLAAIMSNNPNGDWKKLLGIQDQPGQIDGAAADLPKTGDASMLGAWIALLGASAAGMKLRRKNG